MTGDPERVVDADGVPRERRRDGARRADDRGRRRGLRELHAVRRVRAALPEHAVHRRLLPVPHPHGRRRQGRPRARGRVSGIHQPGWQVVERADRRSARHEPVLGDMPVGQETRARLGGGPRHPDRRRDRSSSSTARRRSTARRCRARSRRSSSRPATSSGSWASSGAAAGRPPRWATSTRRARSPSTTWRRGGRPGAKRILVLDPHDYISLHRGLPEVLRRRFRPRGRARGRAVRRADPRRPARARRSPIDRTITYHDPCRLNKRKGIWQEPREILRAIPGLRFEDVDRVTQWSYCSGGGGGLPVEKPELTAAISARPAGERRGSSTSTRS